MAKNKIKNLNDATIEELEAALEAAREREEQKSVAEKYKTLVEEISPKIQAYLNSAYAELEKAKTLSIRTGVPFGFQLGDAERKFIPKKFLEKEKLIEYEDLYEGAIFDDYFWTEYCSGDDWEPWQTSSLRC